MFIKHLFRISKSYWKAEAGESNPKEFAENFLPIYGQLVDNFLCQTWILQIYPFYSLTDPNAAFYRNKRPFTWQPNSHQSISTPQAVSSCDRLLSLLRKWSKSTGSKLYASHDEFFVSQFLIYFITRKNRSQNFDEIHLRSFTFATHVGRC